MLAIDVVGIEAATYLALVEGLGGEAVDDGAEALAGVGVVLGHDAVADSVISVLQAYYPDKHIPICGQDADIAACQNIVRGLQDFTVYKPIVELARSAAEISVRVARGEKIQSLSNLKSIDNKFAEIPAILLKPVLVTKSNVDDVIIDSGFHTYGEVYME